MTYHDDNYGTWHDTHDPEVRRFYRRTQRTNVTKECRQCGRTVRLQPQYDLCGSCADFNEQGW